MTRPVEPVIRCVLAHCGNALAHRACVSRGAVDGTITRCAASAATHATCPHADLEQRKWLLPGRIMLPEHAFEK